MIKDVLAARPPRHCRKRMSHLANASAKDAAAAVEVAAGVEVALSRSPEFVADERLACAEFYCQRLNGC